jgi:hypothetical protein
MRDTIGKYSVVHSVMPGVIPYVRVWCSNDLQIYTCGAWFFYHHAWRVSPFTRHASINCLIKLITRERTVGWQSWYSSVCARASPVTIVIQRMENKISILKNAHFSGINVMKIRKMLISYVRLNHTLYSINYGICFHVVFTIYGFSSLICSSLTDPFSA